MKKTVDYYVGRVLRYLQYRDRSRGEVEQFIERLLQKIEQSTEAKSEIINRIEDFNLLNDNKFADLVIQSRLSQGKGPRYIQQDLLKKGVSRKLVEAALNAIPEEALVKSAQSVILKKFHPIPNTKLGMLKLKKYLLSRGFSMRTIVAAIDLEGQKAVE